MGYAAASAEMIVYLKFGYSSYIQICMYTIALAQTGFSLVYQSKATRGAFDLFAIADTTFIGIQCKKVGLPYYLPISEYEKMDFWAKKLNWIPLLALDIEGKVKFHLLKDLKEKKEKSYRIDENTKHLENLLTLLV